MKAALDEGKHVRFLDWSDKEIDILNKHLFLTAKPMIYLLNMSKKEYIKKKSKWLMPIKQKVKISAQLSDICLNFWYPPEVMKIVGPTF